MDRLHWTANFNETIAGVAFGGDSVVGLTRDAGLRLGQLGFRLKSWMVPWEVACNGCPATLDHVRELPTHAPMAPWRE